MYYINIIKHILKQRSKFETDFNWHERLYTSGDLVHYSISISIGAFSETDIKKYKKLSTGTTLFRESCSWSKTDTEEQVKKHKNHCAKILLVKLVKCGIYFSADELLKLRQTK